MWQSIYLWPISGPVMKAIIVVFISPQAAHERANTRASNHINRNTCFNHALDHTNVSWTSRSTASQDNANWRASQEASQPGKVGHLVNSLVLELLLKVTETSLGKCFEQVVRTADVVVRGAPAPTVEPVDGVFRPWAVHSVQENELFLRSYRKVVDFFF